MLTESRIYDSRLFKSFNNSPLSEKITREAGVCSSTVQLLGSEIQQWECQLRHISRYDRNLERCSLSLIVNIFFFLFSAGVLMHLTPSTR